MWAEDSDSYANKHVENIISQTSHWNVQVPRNKDDAIVNAGQ